MFTWEQAIEVGEVIDHPSGSYIMLRAGFKPPYLASLMAAPNYAELSDASQEQVQEQVVKLGLDDDQWTVDTAYPHKEELLPLSCVSPFAG